MVEGGVGLRREATIITTATLITDDVQRSMTMPSAAAVTSPADPR